MIGIGKLRSACSGLRRSNRRCASLPEEGGESSGDYKLMQGGRRLSLVKKLRKGLHSQEAGQRYRCLIAYTSAVVDLISQSRARARPHPVHLALVPVADEAVVACKAAATILRDEQEPGSAAQERQYSEDAVDHEGVASVGSDQGLALGDKQKTYSDLRLPSLQRRIRGNLLAGYTFRWRVDIL